MQKTLLISSLIALSIFLIYPHIQFQDKRFLKSETSLGIMHVYQTSKGSKDRLSKKKHINFTKNSKFSGIV